MKKFIILVIFCLAFCSFTFAQSFPELEKVKQIKLLESTRYDVKRIFDDADEDSDGDYYSTDIFRISFEYSYGECGEEDSDEEWNVPEGKVTEINLIIIDSDLSKNLKIDLSKLERIKKHQRNTDDDEEEADPNDFVYYDKEKGISYGLDDGEIENIKFIPLEKNYPALCSNENLREFNSTEEWFLNKIKSRPYKEIREYSANVAELTLSENEITAYCITKDSPKGEICSEDAEIEIATKGESGDPTDVLTYNYSVSGGKIIGTGANVTWDLTGVKPGKYTITAGVDNGCGVCGTTRTQEVIVKDCPDCTEKPK
jgi:hypothetical protein